MVLTTAWSQAWGCGRAPAATAAHGLVPLRRTAHVTLTSSDKARFRRDAVAVVRFGPKGKAAAVGAALPSSAALQPAGTAAMGGSGEAAAAADATSGHMSADSDLELVVRAAMQQMGKEYGSKQAALVEKLRDEMYDTAAAFSELREDLLPGLAHQWAAPHRLLATMHRIAAQATKAKAPPPPPPPPSTIQPQGAASAANTLVAPTAAPGAATPGAAPAQQVHGTASAEGHPDTASPPLLAGGPDWSAVAPAEGPAPLAAAVAGPLPLSAGGASQDTGRSETTASAVHHPLSPPREALVPRHRDSTAQAPGDVALPGWGEDEDEEVGRARAQGEGEVEGSEGEADAEEEVVVGIDLEEEEGALSAAEEEEEEDGVGSSSDGDGGGGVSGGGGGGRAVLSGELAVSEWEVKKPEEPDFRKIPIVYRRCPDKSRFGHGSGRRVRLTHRLLGEPYALKESETPGPLAAELREFESFSLYGSFAGSQAGEPLRRATCDGYVQCVRQALGWLYRVENVPLEELRLGLLVPGIHRGAARRVHAFLLWLERERGTTKRSAARSLAALIQLAKFLFHEQSQVREGDKPYSDLEVIKSLRAMYMSYERANRVSGHVVDSSSKWLDWPEYLQYVTELRRECAALKSNGQGRNPVAVAMSLQAYLIAAILSCVPDRQRTLRELVVGKTLVKDKNGIWSIRHTHADYKTGGTYGERPPLVIDPGIYYELEEFINRWRAHLTPKHNFLFTKRDGSAPLTAQELSRSFSLNAYRLTGRKLNPHMVRDMVVTYARSGHASEHELEALAIYMGHSLAEQRGTYDRRTKAEKVQPAMGLLAKISGAAAGLGAGAGAAAALGGPSAAVGLGNRSGGSGAMVGSQALAAAASGAAAVAAERLVLAPPATARGPRQGSRSRRAAPANEPAAAAAADATAAAAPAAAPDGGGVPLEAAPVRRSRARRQQGQESASNEGGEGGTQRKQRRRKAGTAAAANGGEADPAL